VLYLKYRKTTKTNKMKKTLNINGELIETRKFKTLNAANNFIKKGENREVIFFRAHEYYVNI
jgi:hypothetical protein